MIIKRCEWTSNNKLMEEYHDKEWGIPLHEDRRLFEFIVLEGAQAGLTWLTILKKIENYRKAFDEFDVNKIAKYDDAKIKKLLSNDGIIRNKLKIAATIGNAKAFLKVQKEFGSFDNYIWQFVNYKPIKNSWKSLKQVPVKTKESDEMSNDLKKKGFKFVGSTICYAFMQAVGMVNDHMINCFRYKQIK